MSPSSYRAGHGRSTALGRLSALHLPFGRVLCLFGIAAPMTTDPKPASWGFLGLAGLIGGGPTFIGTWIGYLASSTYLSVAFLAVAAGALLYVLNELFHIGRRLCSPPQFAWGLLAGFLTAFATDLLLTAVS